jgi:membrane protein
MRGRVKPLLSLLGAAADAWLDDNVPRLAASVAFYTVLSLLPFVILISAIAADELGRKAAEGELLWELQDFIGPVSAQAVQSLIRSATRSTTAATIFGSLMLAFGASAVVMELREALNSIWHVQAVASVSGAAKFLHLVKERFYLFGVILGAGFLLFISLAVNAYVSALTASMGPAMTIAPALLHTLVFAGSYIIITALFAAIYKIVPDTPLTWPDVTIGASFTALLVTIGKQLIGLYLGRVNYASTYGAAGSLLILLVWVYYSAQLFFFGAEFTKVYANKTRAASAAALPKKIA